MKYLGYVTAFIIFMVLSVSYSGYALSVLWGWFVVPTFNLKPISIPVAIGLAIVVSYLTNHTDSSQENNGDTFTEVLAKLTGRALFKPTIALLVGWVVTFFI
jgi:hypothetical protein